MLLKNMLPVNPAKVIINTCGTLPRKRDSAILSLIKRDVSFTVLNLSIDKRTNRRYAIGMIIDNLYNVMYL